MTKLNYGKQWDRFYASLGPGGEKKPLWDVEPDQACERDYEIFQPYFDNTLPLIDIGCGTGRQTDYLTRYYEVVHGMDVAETAINLARTNYSRDGLSFSTIDETREDFFSDIHQRFGDSNVYIRGVLHQIEEDHIADFVRNMETLIGNKGNIYFVEVADGIREYFRQAPGQFSKMPESIQRTFISRLPPRGLNLDHLNAVFPNDRFRIVEKGETRLNTIIQFQNRESIEIPAVYGVVSPK